MDHRAGHGSGGVQLPLDDARRAPPRPARGRRSRPRGRTASASSSARAREREPLLDLAAALGRALAEPALELVERRVDEDRDRAGHVVLARASAPSISSSSSGTRALVADAVDLGAQRPVAVARRDVDPLEELAGVDARVELLVGRGTSSRAVLLARAAAAASSPRPRARAPGMPLEQRLIQRPLAGARRAGDDEDWRQRPLSRLKRPISSCRWRSERPPTVFDWLIRHWLSNRAAFTRPNFGTAMSMSKTFAVETYSGGSRRISSIWTLAVLEVLLQLRALDPDVVGSLEGLHPLVERPNGSLDLGLGRHHECGSLTSSQPRASRSHAFCHVLPSRASMRFVGEPDGTRSESRKPERGDAPRRAPRARARARRGRRRARSRARRAVAPQASSSSASRPVCTPPMPTIGRLGRAAAGVDGGERDRLQRRPGVAAGRRARASAAARSSSARPRIVLTSESPSAPAASTARATSAMSQAAGESFA